MSHNNLEAERAVTKLLKADESQLYETLAIREQAIAKSPELAQRFDLDVAYANVMGPREVLQEIGMGILNRWNKETYGLICGDDAQAQAQRKELLGAVGVGGGAAAATYLAGVLVLIPGLAPALAAVLAVIVWKRFVSPAGEEFCVVWKKHLSA